MIYYALFNSEKGYYHGYCHGNRRWRAYPKLWKRKGDASVARACMRSGVERQLTYLVEADVLIVGKELLK